MKAITKTVVATLAVAVAAVACAALTPEQQQGALDALEQARQAGTISEQQFAAAREAVLQGGTSELAKLGVEFLRTAIDVGLALLGVRVWRGSIEHRKGVVPVIPVAPVTP